MFKLPFGVMPGHWGLKGRTRDTAKAEYELTGIDLEKRLLEINKDVMSEDIYKRRLIEIDFKYKIIDSYEYRIMLAGLIKDDTQRQIATLEVEYSNGNMTEIEYQKAVATIKKEPWVTVLSMDFSGKGSLEGSFELDWNEAFVEKLIADGYKGPSADIIVNQWFMEVCRNVAMEEFDGTGDFAADSEANLNTLKRWSSDKKPIGGGLNGYS